MIDPMDWINILITLGAIIATATAVVISIRGQLLGQRREIEMLQDEVKECRERIDNLILYRGRNGRPPEKD